MLQIRVWAADLHQLNELQVSSTINSLCPPSFVTEWWLCHCIIRISQVPNSATTSAFQTQDWLKLFLLYLTNSVTWRLNVYTRTWSIILISYIYIILKIYDISFSRWTGNDKIRVLWASRKKSRPRISAGISSCPLQLKRGIYPTSKK